MQYLNVFPVSLGPGKSIKLRSTIGEYLVSIVLRKGQTVVIADENKLMRIVLDDNGTECLLECHTRMNL